MSPLCSSEFSISVFMRPRKQRESRRGVPASGSSDFAVDGDVIMALAREMKERFLGAG